MKLPKIKHIIKTEKEEYEEEIIEEKKKDDVKRAASQNVVNIGKKPIEVKRGGFASKYYGKK